jgi:hypothetical protein
MSLAKADVLVCRGAFRRVAKADLPTASTLAETQKSKHKPQTSAGLRSPKVERRIVLLAYKCIVFASSGR